MNRAMALPLFFAAFGLSRVALRHRPRRNGEHPHPKDPIRPLSRLAS